MPKDPYNIAEGRVGMVRGIVAEIYFVIFDARLCILVQNW